MPLSGCHIGRGAASERRAEGAVSRGRWPDGGRLQSAEILCLFSSAGTRTISLSPPTSSIHLFIGPIFHPLSPLLSQALPAISQSDEIYLCLDSLYVKNIARAEKGGKSD